MKNILKNIFYKIVDILTLGKGVKREINGVEIKFPPKYFRFFEHDYESENFKIFKENIKPGDVIIDIGAHIGLQSVTMAKFAGNTGRVFSFEPTLNTYAVLKETIRLNHLTNVVTAINKAVSADAGTAEFYSTDVGVANSLVSYANTNSHHKTSVMVTSIDLFAANEHLDKIDFIKIDAEGVEFDVLKGAETVINKYHPSMILALHPPAIRANGNSLADIYDVVSKYGYTVLFGNEKLTKEAFCSKDNLFDVFLF